MLGGGGEALELGLGGARCRHSGGGNAGAGQRRPEDASLPGSSPWPSSGTLGSPCMQGVKEHKILR